MAVYLSPAECALAEQALVDLAAKVPALLVIDFYCVTGFSAAYYSIDGESISYSRDEIEAMGHANIALLQTVSSNLKLGVWTYYVTSGKLGHCIYLSLPNNDAYILILVVAPGQSIDAVLRALRQSWQPLLDLLKA